MKCSVPGTAAASLSASLKGTRTLELPCASEITPVRNGHSGREEELGRGDSVLDPQVTGCPERPFLALHSESGFSKAAQKL